MPPVRNRDAGISKGAAAIASLIYSTTRFLVNRADEKRALRLGLGMSRLLYGGLRNKRLANYRLFFGEADSARDEKLEADYLAFMGQVAAENIRSTEIDLDTFRARCGLQGQEHLDAALKQGRGVILLGAHLGNFYAYHQALSLHGYPLVSIAKPLPVVSMERQTDRIRERYRISGAVVDDNAARAAVRAFRENRILSIVFDLVTRPEKTVALPFGAANLDFDIGPALLAVRFGVPVVPITIDSQTPYHPKIAVQPSFPMPQGDNEKARALDLLSHWRDWLQAEMVKQPEQWCSWSFSNLHNRLTTEAA